MKYGDEDTSKRTSKRKPSTARYFSSRRWITNKAKRVAKQAKFEAKKKLKKQLKSS